MILKPIPRPKRLKAVADLGPYEINVGALSKHHVGLTVAVRRGRNLITGPLRYEPTESMTKPLLVLAVGDVSVALHSADVVMVIPDDYRATITVAPKPAAGTDQETPND